MSKQPLSEPTASTVGLCPTIIHSRAPQHYIYIFAPPDHLLFSCEGFGNTVSEIGESIYYEGRLKSSEPDQEAGAAEP